MPTWLCIVLDPEALPLSTILLLFSAVTQNPKKLQIINNELQKIVDLEDCLSLPSFAQANDS